MKPDPRTVADRLSGIRADFPWMLGRPGPSIALMGLPVLFGLTYLGAEWARTARIEDEWFVGLLLGATVMLVQGMRTLKAWIEERAPSFFLSADLELDDESIRSEASGFGKSIFDDRKMLLAGVAYGIAVASAPFLLHVWQDDPPLQLLLALFLFSVNFVTGVGFLGLILLFIEMWRVRDLVSVSVWHRRNASTDFIDGVRNWTAVLASVYVSISLSSILFSKLPVGNLIFAYSAFTAIIILAAFAVPGAFVRNRLLMERLYVLAELDEQLEREYGRLLKMVKSSDVSADFGRVEGLIALRERVEGVATWPVGWRSIRTAAGVLLVTTLPVFLERILRTL